MATTKVEVAAATRRGSSSLINEDAIGVGGWALWGGEQVTASPCWTHETLLTAGAAPITFVVADGLGGLPGAQQGSLTVAECASRPGIGGPEDLRAALGEAHQRILGLQAASLNMEMGATVAGVTVTPLGSVVCFNVGDSRVYFANGDTLVQATRDDAERLPFSTRASLTKWLGQPGAEVDRPWTRRLEPNPHHHRLLVCTDGLYSAVESEELQAVMCDPTVQSASRMVERLMAISGQTTDDSTVVVVQVLPYEESEGQPRRGRHKWWL